MKYDEYKYGPYFCITSLWKIIYPWLWWGWQKKTDDRMRWQQWQCWQGGERNVINIKPKTNTNTMTNTKKDKDTIGCVGNNGNAGKGRKEMSKHQTQRQRQKYS